jgi:heterotetrameric sarcosine oxidase gamma subunit
MNQPYKLTPTHAWHAQNGAQTSVVDGWVRVLGYGDQKGEIQATNSDVGICDVSPLSKIDIQGKRSGALIEDLAGIPLPDIGGSASLMLRGCSKPAYVARLQSEKYLVLTVAGLREQLYSCLVNEARENDCVHPTDVTSAYAALQLAGPKAAPLLKKLVSAPVDQIRTGHCVQTSTARVWSLVIHHESRQGSSWLVLVSRDFGEYVWETILESGQEFGIRPFGMSAAQIITGMEELDVATL